MTEGFCVILRADTALGTGHLMRVLPLVGRLEGFEFHLLSDSLDEGLRPRCAAFKSVTVAARDALPALALELKPRITLIDHYFIDARLEERLYPYCRVAVIDDLANRPHRAHVLFDQGPERTAADYAPLVNPECELCLGPRYTTVREEFRRAAPHVPGRKLKVLVNFGGTDPRWAVLEAARGIAAAKLYLDYDFTLITGLNEELYQRVRELTLGLPLVLERYCADMPRCFARHDLAVGACGVTLSERLAAGLPGLNVVIADNQAGAPAVIDKYRLGLNYPLEALRDGAALRAALRALWERAAEFRRNGQALIDGRGYERISRVLSRLA